MVFISNYLNHHQLPFCMEMQKLTKGNFVFIATTPISDARKKFGYEDMNQKFDFVLCAYESKENQAKAQELCETCDVLIYGSAPDHYFIPRVKAKKLTFKYAERFFKTPFTIKNLFHRVGSMLKHTIPYQNKNHLLLCASAYTSNDAALFGCFKNRALKWGYFPEVKLHNIAQLWDQKRQNSILWVGRMLPLKHPEMAIEVARRLKKAKIDFSLTMIGSGPMEVCIQEDIKRYQLEDKVKCLGAMSPEEVRTYMENSEIFLFTSDRNEGWGAVLNESMNSGCAVVASNAIGAVPFLIEDGKNGLIFKSENVDSLYDQVSRLLREPGRSRVIGMQAYDTMANQWNAKNAAQRLLVLIDEINSGKHPETVFADGVCSSAKYNNTNKTMK